MAIVSVGEIHPGRRGSEKDDLTGDDVRSFRIWTDDPTDDAALILAAGLLPRIGDQHLRNVNLCVEEVQVDQQDESFLLWIATVNYATKPVAGLEGDSGAQELKVERSWEPSDEKEIVDKDINGKPLRYKNGVPFTLEKPALRLRVRITRPESSFDGEAAQQYHGHINSATISGGAPGTVRLKISANEVQEGSFRYWNVSYELEFNPDGWNPKVLEAGYQQWVYDGLSDFFGLPTDAPADISTRRRERILDENGEPVTTPWPLDNYGRAIAREFADDYEFYNEHLLYKTADFGDLNLPITA